MPQLRANAALVGTLFLLTHVTSVTARLLYGTADPVLERVGTVLEVVLAVAVVGTAVALYPVARRVAPSVAIGYVGLRTLEAGVILAGVVAMLASLGLHGELADAMRSFEEWAFVVGPGLTCGVNTVLMAWIMYTSGLVPRIIGVLGLVGGPLVFAINLVKLFGFEAAVSPWGGLAVVPVFAWEISLALYLLIRGYRSTGLVGGSNSSSSGSDVAK